MLTIQSFFGDMTGLQWSGIWLPLVILAVFTSIMFYNILLMIGKAFSLREVERFAKSEMLQALSTAFMASFLVMLVGGAMELTGQFLHGEFACGDDVIHISSLDDGQSTMENVFDAIRCRLQSRAKEVARIQGALVGGLGPANEFNLLNTALSSFGITFFKGDWVGELYRAVETKRIANNLATVLLIGLNAQSDVLQYIKINSLNVLLPLGILLRSFYFTRSVGALFISIAVGMFFIFPVFFILLDPGFTASAPPPSFAGAQQETFCYATMKNTISMVDAISQLSAAGPNLGMEQLEEDLTKSYISLIIHPLVSFFLTMVFIRYMMVLLGGDSTEITRMVTKVV